MYIKIAYRCTDERGYDLKEADKIFGLTIHTTQDKDGYGHKTDVPILMMEGWRGSYKLKYPAFEISSHFIKVHGMAEHLTAPDVPLPKDCCSSIIHVMERWTLKVHLETDEEKEYEKWHKAMLKERDERGF